MALTIQYIPHHQLAHLETNVKLRRILKSVKEDKVILIEGRLNAFEEAELIRKTMEQIDRKFKGIEICSIDHKGKDPAFGDRFRELVANIILGKNSGLTIVGPATVIKEIKKDPNKVELLTHLGTKKRTRRKKR